MDTIATIIELDDMGPGDAFNKPGSHIVLWLKEGTDGAPLFYEAAGDPVSKVWKNESATWSYLDGYDPIRYDKLLDGPGLTYGSVLSPYVIDHVPYHHDCDTTLSPHADFDSYSCAPMTDEKGPEVIYVFSAETTGMLTATVEDGAGVDIDIHLLELLDPADCITRDDKSITVQLSPGTYYLVLDTWSNDTDVRYSGPYALDVDFDGELGDTSDTVEPPDTACPPCTPDCPTCPTCPTCDECVCPTVTCPDIVCSQTECRAPPPEDEGCGMGSTTGGRGLLVIVALLLLMRTRRERSRR